MALSDSTQVSLALLQTVGLLIPVIFLSLSDSLSDASKTTIRYRTVGDGPAESSDNDIEEKDVAPNTIRLGWLIVLLLAISGVLAGIQVLQAQADSMLVAAAIVCLILGLLGLALLFYLVRSSFTIEYV